MKTKLLTALLVGCGTLGANAQTTIPIEWANRYQTVMDSLTSNFQSPDGEPVGISMAVNVPGIGAWQGASGMAVPGELITTSMTTGIGSNSKLFTAVILLKLQQDGLLSLNDQIGQYITEDLNYIDKTVTIKQLLSHETGFFDYVNDRVDDFYADVLADLDKHWTIPEVLATIGEPHFAKGTAYRYSNTNYTIAAWIIEKVTNKSYAENLHEHITIPLELTRTFEADETIALEGIPQSSTYFGGLWYPGLGYPGYYSNFIGGGSIVSTPKDMAQFYQAVFDSTFLNPQSKQQLLDFDAASRYGLGIEHVQSGSLQRETYSHTGSVAGFQSEATYDPMTGASIFWIVNHDQAIFFDYSTAIRREFRKGYPKQVNDAGIERIVSPRSTVCTGSLLPVVKLKNYGSATLTSAVIKYQLNNNANIFTYNWTGSLASNAGTDVTLTGIPANNGSNHFLKIWTESPNGSTEGYTYNDEKTATFDVLTSGAQITSFSEDFEGETTAVKIWSPSHDNTDNWGITSLTGNSGSHSLVTANIHTLVTGNETIADLPTIQLNDDKALTFTYAYSYMEGYEDRLKVELSNDCGVTWNTLFDKSNAELSQGLSGNINDGYGIYFPHSSDEWHTETISLNQYTGGDIQIRFKSILNSPGGDNLYLDDIAIGAALGIADVVKDGITIYPNPASNAVTIKGLPAKTLVTLHNITGQHLQQTVTNDDSATLNVSSLAPGVYFLSTPQGNRKIIKK